MDTDEFRGQFDRLEQLILEAGYEHAQKLREFRAIVRALTHETANGYAREKLIKAGLWAGDLFSERKHRSYDTSASTGAERISGFIREDLSKAQENMGVGPADKRPI